MPRFTRRHRNRFVGGQAIPMNNSSSRPAMGNIYVAEPLPVNSNVESVVSENLNMDGLNANELNAFLALGDGTNNTNAFPNNISVIPHMNENTNAFPNNIRHMNENTNTFPNNISVIPHMNENTNAIPTNRRMNENTTNASTGGKRRKSRKSRKSLRRRR